MHYQPFLCSWYIYIYIISVWAGRGCSPQAKWGERGGWRRWRGRRWKLKFYPQDWGDHRHHDLQSYRPCYHDMSRRGSQFCHQRFVWMLTWSKEHSTCLCVCGQSISPRPILLKDKVLIHEILGLHSDQYNQGDLADWRPSHKIKMGSILNIIFHVVDRVKILLLDQE